MSVSRRIHLALAALALGAAPPATAQQADAGATARPALTIAVQNRTAAEEALQGAARADTTVRPGDVLRYTLRFANPTERALRQVTLSNPLPAALRLVAGSPRASRSDARLEFSADGGRTFSTTPAIEVVVEGKTVRRPVPPEQYTHVRWTVDGAVAPRSTVTAEYEARVSTGPRDSRGGPSSPSPRAGSR